MSVLRLQTMQPRAVEYGVLGNSCSSSTHSCCNGEQQK
ncbi:class III lanthipeptide [Micromonospora qiuiae]|nr:class III lanthipeptide [Micromonospora qiuiae]